MSDPPQAPRNPVADWFRGWSSGTAVVTRYVMLTIAGIYLLGLLTGQSSFAFSSCPYYIVFHFEVYRLFLSVLFQDGLLAVAFVLFAFSSMGNRLEKALGSLGFLSAIVQQTVVTNVLHTMLCLALAYNPVSADPSYLMSCGSGFWSVILGMVVLECSIYPAENRRLLFLPVNIPTKFYPLAFMAFLMLFSGFSLTLLLGCGVGYLRIHGYLQSITPSSTTLARTEAAAGVGGELGNSTGGGSGLGCCASMSVGFVGWMGARPGYVTASSALGGEVFAPRDPLQAAEAGNSSSAAGGGGNNGGGSSWTSTAGGGFWPNGRANAPGRAAGSDAASDAGGGGPKTTFPGGGQTLGGSSASASSSFFSTSGNSGGGAASAARNRAAAAAAAERRFGNSSRAGTQSSSSVDDRVPLQAFTGGAEPVDAGSQYEHQIMQLQGMGYSYEESARALGRANGDVGQAVAHLTSSQ